MRLFLLAASALLFGCASTSASTSIAASESKVDLQVESEPKLEYLPANFDQRKWVKGRLLEEFREQGVNSIAADACAKNVTFGLGATPNSLAVNSAGGAKISPLFVMEIWSHAASKLKVNESYDPKDAFPPKVTKGYCHRLYKTAIESAHDDITEYLKAES